MMNIDQMVGLVLLKLTPAFELYEVFTIEHIKDVLLVLALKVPIDVTIVALYLRMLLVQMW